MSARSLSISAAAVAVVGLAAAGIACPGEQVSRQTFQLASTSGAVPSTYFGLNVIGLGRGTPVPTISFGAWRNFYSQWYRLEPRPGEWDFTELDEEVKLANERGIAVTLVLGNPPTWASAQPTKPGWFSGAPPGTSSLPRRIEEWTTYVKALADRYKGSVEAFELWNEPNNFLGEPAEALVPFGRAAYEAIKSTDARILVLSPAVSLGGLRYLDQYLAAGGAETFDVLAVHFYVSAHNGYPRPPEEMLPAIRRVRELMKRHGIANKPLWNTETGWAVANRLQSRQAEGEAFMGHALEARRAAAYLARAFIVSWHAGVQRLYWYAWGTSGMSIVDPADGTPKLAAKAFTEIQRWLTGKSFRSCDSDADSTWICVLEGVRGEHSCIVWNTSGRVRHHVRNICPNGRLLDLEGQRRNVVDGVIDAEMTPVLLESGTR